MIKISPSILAADVLNMGNDIERIISAGADMLHLDIMDGHFVPNISYGPDLVKAINNRFDIPLDVHLMLSQPLKYIDKFIDAGSDYITVHYEADDFFETIKYIKSKGIKAGASLKPATPKEVLKDYFDYLDMILIMTVEPGFGGQKFMENCIEKIAYMRENGFKGIINVDGGVNMENSKLCTLSGADMLVMGTALFKIENPKEVIDYIHSL